MYKPKLRSSLPIFKVLFQKNVSSKHDKAPMLNIMYIVKTNDTRFGYAHFNPINTIGAI